MKKKANVIAELDNILSELAAVKAAESSADEGKVQNQGDSGTAHPSKDVSDGTQPATEGSRSAENTSDVKSQTPGQAVDAAKEDKLDGASEPKLTTAKPTGEDPSNETSSAKGELDSNAGKNIDGEDTEHPAKADFGGKYASLKQAAAAVTELSNTFLAKTAALQFTPRQSTKKAEDVKPVEAKKPAKKDAAPMDSEKSCDKAAGEKAAAEAADALGLTQNKVNDLKLKIAQAAYDDAHRVAAFYSGLRDGSAEKQAAAPALAAAAPAPVAAKPAVAKPLAPKPVAAAKPAAAAAKQASHNLATILAHLIKQSGEEGADAMAYGGDASATPAQATEEAAQAGEASPEGTHPEPDGDEGLIQELLQALQQAGISPEVLAQIPPEELEAALAQAGAGGADGSDQPVEQPQSNGVEAVA